MFVLVLKKASRDDVLMIKIEDEDFVVVLECFGFRCNCCLNLTHKDIHKISIQSF